LSVGTEGSSNPHCASPQTLPLIADMTPLVRHIFCFFILITLSTCKKYPDNTLWFKNPKKVSPFYGYLKKYTVNGIDSLDLLNNYFGHAFGLVVKDIRRARFDTEKHRSGWLEAKWIVSGFTLPVGFDYLRKNCYVHLSCGADTSIFKKILFISPDIEWQILQLGKDPFKAKTTLENGNTYEIEIGT
jgi:hypothetical protein